MIWHGIYKQLVQVFIENISNQLFFAIFVNAEKICSVWKSCLNIFQQLFFGLIFGVLFGKGAVWALNRLQFQITSFEKIIHSHSRHIQQTIFIHPIPVEKIIADGCL